MHSLPLFGVLITIAGLLFSSCSSQDLSPDMAGATLAHHSYLSRADSLLDEGVRLTAISKLDSSSLLLEEARGLFEEKEDWRMTMHTMNLLSVNERKAGRYDRALELVNQARQLQEVHLEGKQDSLIATSLYEVGNYYYYKSDYEQALDFHNRSLAMRQNLFGEHHPRTADSYNNLGLVYMRNGELEQALTMFENSLDIRIDLLGPDHEETAQSFQNLAGLYRVFGYYDKGLEYSNKALAVKIEKYGANDLQTSSLYNTIAGLYQAKGDYDASLQYVEKSLAINEKQYGQDHLYIPMFNLNICMLYSNKEEYDTALTYCNRANTLFRRIAGENHLYTARSYDFLGTIYSEMGEYDKALAQYAKERDILNRVVGKEHVDHGGVLFGTAKVYARQGKFQEALQGYQESLSLLSRVYGPHSPVVAEVLNYQGRLYVQMGEYEASKTSYAESVCVFLVQCTGTILHDIQSLEVRELSQWLIKSIAGYLNAVLMQYETRTTPLEDLEEVLHIAVEAIDLITEIRSNYTAEGSKVTLGETSMAIFESGIQAAMQLYRLTEKEQYKETAFYLTQKSKTGIFLDALAESKAQQFSGIPDSLLTRSKELRVDLAYYKTKLYEAQLKGAAADSSALYLLKDKTFNLEQDYVQLLAYLESNYPDYYRLKYDVNVTTPAQLREWVLDENTVLAEYFLGRDSLYTFVLSESSTEMYSAPVDSAFFDHITSMRASIVERTYETYIESAQHLYQVLVAPWASAVEMERLIVVAVGELNLIPFEALLTAAPAGDMINYQSLPYLLNEYSMMYAHSATLLSQKPKRTDEEPTKDLIAFAPIFEDGLSSQVRGAEVLGLEASGNADDEGEPDRLRGYLPGTEREAKEILNLFRSRYSFWERLFGGQSKVYWSKEATESQAKKGELRDYRYVHFATHGVVNESIPDLSGIVLVQDTSNQEDGVLHLSEVYNLDLNAELVVLSACETGLGKIARGEGLIGLTRGFMYSGAQSVAVSLWKVEDTSTKDLMIGYYDGILNGKRKADALRESKQLLIASGHELAQPYYWAGFIQVGE